MRLLLMLSLFVCACGDDTSPDSDAGEADAPPIDAGDVDAMSDAVVDVGVDAGPEPCSMEGEMRAAVCGNCGLTQEVCEGGFWVAGECLAEGECAPGALDEEDLGMCARRTRICDDMCAWSDWDMTAEAGDCEPGATRSIPADCGPTESRPQECSDACVWLTTGECESGCAGTPRTSPSDSEEMCVPAGPFVRGDSMFADAMPVAEVYVSAFYLDRYPVTHRRYRECIADGGCNDVESDFYRDNFLNNPDYVDAPMESTSFEEASAFCEWDGDRRLPTEAEWEKAARGPAPRTNGWVWEDGTYHCDDLPAAGCPGYVGTSLPEAVTAYPDTASFYGVEVLGGIATEWTADFYSATYYTDAASLTDPQGPPDGTMRVTRGQRRSTGSTFLRISRRFPASISLAREALRCARSAE